jgi:hypothetical protein
MEDDQYSIQSWVLVASGPSIIDWIPSAERNLHDLGRKCECHPEKGLRYDGPHVVSVHFKHRVLART